MLVIQTSSCEDFVITGMYGSTCPQLLSDMTTLYGVVNAALIPQTAATPSLADGRRTAVPGDVALHRAVLLRPAVPVGVVAVFAGFLRGLPLR